MCKVQGRASFTISKVIAYVCYKLIKMAKRAGQIGVVRLRFCLKAVNNAPNICYIREIKINFLLLEFGPSKSFGWFCATDHFASWMNGISDKKLVQARTDPKVEQEKIKRVRHANYWNHMRKSAYGTLLSHGFLRTQTHQTLFQPTPTCLLFIYSFLFNFDSQD